MGQELQNIILKHFEFKENRMLLGCEIDDFTKDKQITLVLTPYFLLRILNEIFAKYKSNEIKNLTEKIKKNEIVEGFKFDFEDIDKSLTLPDSVSMIISKEGASNKFGTKEYKLALNEFLLKSINNNNPIRVKNQAKEVNTQTDADRLNVLFGLLSESFRLYNQYIENGFNSITARKNSGLENDLLFEIAKIKSDEI